MKPKNLQDLKAGGKGILPYVLLAIAALLFVIGAGVILIAALTQEPAKPGAAVCGDGLCSGNETLSTCCQDCKALNQCCEKDACGEGKYCDMTTRYCKQIPKIAKCGNEECETGENACSCPEDCQDENNACCGGAAVYNPAAKRCCSDGTIGECCNDGQCTEGMKCSADNRTCKAAGEAKQYTCAEKGLMCCMGGEVCGGNSYAEYTCDGICCDSACKAPEGGLLLEEGFESLAGLEANDGGIFGNVDFVSGKEKNAAKIGVGRIEYSSGSPFTTGVKGAVEFWFSPSWYTNNTSRKHLFESTQYDTFRIEKNGTELRIIITCKNKDDEANTWRVAKDISKWQKSAWYHIAASWDFSSANKPLNLYIDGAKSTIYTNCDSYASRGNITIGSSNSANIPEGTFDELKAYSYMKDFS